LENGGKREGAGRPPGALNKRTREIMESITKVINKLSETLEGDIEKLKPAERVKLWNDLQEYATPKLARTEIIDTSEKKIIIEVVRETPKDQPQLDRGKDTDTPALPPSQATGNT